MDVSDVPYGSEFACVLLTYSQHSSHLQHQPDIFFSLNLLSTRSSLITILQYFQDNYSKALIRAVSAGNTLIVKQLLSKGADIHYEDGVSVMTWSKMTVARSVGYLLLTLLALTLALSFAERRLGTHAGGLPGVRVHRQGAARERFLRQGNRVIGVTFSVRIARQ